MKTITLGALVGAASLATALSIPSTLRQAVSQLASGQNPLASAERYLIELAPSQTQWVTEEEKWQLRRQNINFFDITETPDLATTTSRSTVRFPSKTAHNESITPLLKTLDKQHMISDLTTFTAFHTRYYRSDYGRQSSEWLLAQVNHTLSSASKNTSTSTSTSSNFTGHVRPFPHSWGQASIIATLPGKSANTIVIGAHQDSTNLFLPSLLAAPGADDDGSGTVTILEALRVLLHDPKILAGEQENTVEFHWYSAEEGGLLGSQAIFSAYQKSGRSVKAMLQQDMTGYTHATLAAGEPESVGVITDYVDPGLTSFIKEVVTEYCTIPFIETKCGYACSDHASASKAGYPSAFVIESDFKYSDKKIHTTDDKLEYLDFDHMLQHARLTLGLAYELAFAKFE
ncbi:hypothetical protein BAUCODRAFT_245698 [Baudoinia panamericana UAMH 10762]|uniref:Peptide hydrolase n=1 Tax=Baudoinia panamericana (strain UAMH 10762) TaxID=717646 RepID=M2MQ30_BAUPA|nr:uncharacterized protein BAUCODRAFT_245698 [Baudoinia panamericana UAMH 10762]EMC93563.1 hypothetical protein BAUCODRAFT_245698 [Baudoinia panamericana UAMH 10762]